MPSLHAFAVPPLLNGMRNMIAILEKARASPLDEATILNARIHPDMLPFPVQIFLVATVPGDLPSQLNPSLPKRPTGPPDETPTLDSLLERLRVTISFLESIKPEDLDGRDEERVSFTYGGSDDGFTAEYSAVEFVGDHAHPNFWFHFTTAYNLLRGAGLAIGKRDFLNAAGLRKWEPVKA